MAINSIGNSSVQAPAAALPAQGSSQGNPAPAALPESAPQQPKPENFRQAAETLRQMVESKAPNSLQFSVDDATGKTVVRITDAKTGEMIRQIPSEELLELARSLDKMQGMLLQQKA